METFPSLSELLVNPVVASAVVVIIVNVLQYAFKLNANWLAILVGVLYMIGGYIVTGKTAPEQLFVALIYAFLIVAPLSHVDANLLNKLFGKDKLTTTAVSSPQLFPRWF